MQIHKPLDLSQNKSRGDFMCHRTNGSNNITPLPTVTTGHKPLDDKRERQDGPGGN